MIRILLDIIRKARIPSYLHKCSNHVYTVWQHLVLLSLRQYEQKSYRRFLDFLHECTTIQQQLQLSRLPHYTTLQKASSRLESTILHKILSEFILYIKVRLVLVGIDGTGFGHGQSSYYYTKRAKLRRRFVKVSIAADMNHQIVCAIKIRHQPRHDNINFAPLLEKTNQIIPVNTVVADKGYDSESNHVAAKNLGIASVIIPPRYADVPVRKTKGHYRKALKRNGYDCVIYHQRNKVETIFSVIKRMFGDCVTSRNIVTINHELIYRVIAYNCHRIMRNNLIFRIWFLHGLRNHTFVFYANFTIVSLGFIR